MIIEQVVIGITNAQKSQDQNLKSSMSVTNIPYFDIAFENIYVSGKSNANRFDHKVEIVEKNLDLLTGIFGYKQGT